MNLLTTKMLSRIKIDGFILVVVLLPCFASASQNSRDHTYIRDLWTRADNIMPSYDQQSLEKQWYEIDSRFHYLSGQLYDLGIELFSRTSLGNFKNLPVLSAQCKRSLFDVFASTIRLEPWAYFMVASSGIIPTSSGSGISYGSYDICVNVKNRKKFVGQYCTLEVTFPFPKIGAYIARPKDVPLPKNFTVPNSLTDLLVTTLAPYFYFAFMIVAVCVPSTCSVHDVQEAANKLVDVVGINASARVIGCQVKEELKFNTFDFFAMSVLAVAVFISALGTIAYLIQRKKGKVKQAGVFFRILFCFSIPKNNKRLFEPENCNIRRVFSGMQVLTLLWLIVFHSHWFIPLNLYGSVTPVEQPYVPFNFETVRNGFLGFDTLFFIAAALLMYQRLQNSKQFGVAQYVIAKVLYLAPGLMFVAATAILARHVTNGPIWKEIVHPISRRCEINWWTNMLFVNNFISSSEQCLMWSWYTASEMQLFLLSLLVLVPIMKKPKLGLYILAAAFGIGLAASVANHISYDLPPTVVLSALYYPDDIIYFMDHGLFPSYLHLTSYCIGLAVGYFLHKRPNLKFSDRTNTIAYVVSISIGFSIICCVHSWNTLGHQPPNLILSTIYSVAGKVIWCIAIGWISVTCITANEGTIHSILSWSGFVPLGRLVYMSYLLHPLIILMYVGSVRFPIQADPKTLTFMGFGLVVGTLIAAYIFHIFFEAPFTALAQLFLSPDKQEEILETDTEKKVKPGQSKVISISIGNDSKSSNHN